MALVPAKNRLRIAVLTDDEEREVDLSSLRFEDFFRNDLVRYKISGEIPPADFRPVNFIQCAIVDATASGISFLECDFKDTLIRGSRFSDCKFDNGAFAAASLYDCEFINCSFYNTAIYGSDFYRTTLMSCNLDHLLVKSSRFFECSFISCHTTNRLMEMSTLESTSFRDTEIQLQTITANFGLTQTDLIQSPIRSGRKRETYSFIDAHGLLALMSDPSLSPIEKLRLEYFLNSDLIFGSDFLDQALNLSRWTSTYKNPGSFVELLEGFSEFIVFLYDRNKLSTQAVLLLHFVTSTLMKEAPGSTDLHRVAMALGGTHMILSRLVEGYLEALSSLAEENEKSVTLLVEESEGQEFYYKALAPWFEGGNLEIVSFVKHNSPFEMQIIAHWGSVVPILAVFLSCRTKLEISRIRQQAKARLAPRRKSQELQDSRPSPSNPARDQVLALSAGMARDEPGTYEFQMKALLPGSLMLDLKLQFGTKFAGRLRKLLHAIVS